MKWSGIARNNARDGSSAMLSKSRNRRRRRAKSQAWTQAAKATSAQESFIPAGHENTRREELQCEARREKEQARKDKAQERQQQGAEKAAQLEEKLREEVLYNQKNYVRRITKRLKHPRLPASDPCVRCLWIFGGNASTYTANILALCDWASKFFKIGGEYPVPKLPGWLTTYVHVTSLSRFPDGLPQLPKRRTAMNLSNVAVRAPYTWQWMADLLQYWIDVSNTKTQDGLSQTQIVLVKRVMDTVNPHFPAKERVTWAKVAFRTFHWLESRTVFTQEEKADYDCQLKREDMELNDLEIETQKLWCNWLEAKELDKERAQAKKAASKVLPPECRAAQLEREKQAKVTGLNKPTKSKDRYPGWTVCPRKKPAADADAPAPYQTPGDLRRKDMTIAECDAALEAELGGDRVLDPLAPSPGPCSSPGPQTPPQFSDADVDIPSIELPGASPITNADDQLLGAVSESPMETTSASTSTVSTPMFSRAPGSAVSSTRCTPMSGASPAVGSPPPGLG